MNPILKKIQTTKIKKQTNRVIFKEVCNLIMSHLKR